MSKMTDEEKAARQAYAYSLRAKGMTLEQIGKRLGLSKERARQLVVFEEWKLTGYTRP